MDMNFPDMNCVEILKEIFCNGAWRKVIILAEMQCISRHHLRQLLDLGIAAVATKPLSIPTIAQMLKL